MRKMQLLFILYIKFNVLSVVHLLLILNYVSKYSTQREDGLHILNSVPEVYKNRRKVYSHKERMLKEKEEKSWLHILWRSIRLWIRYIQDNPLRIPEALTHSPILQPHTEGKTFLENIFFILRPLSLEIAQS